MKHGEKTKQRILDVAVSCWPDVTVTNVARACGFRSHRSVSYHFASDKLKDLTAAHAVKIGNSRVIVQLMLLNHKAVKGLSKAQMQEHLNNIQKPSRTK